MQNQLLGGFGLWAMAVDHWLRRREVDGVFWSSQKFGGCNTGRDWSDETSS